MARYAALTLAGLAARMWADPVLLSPRLQRVTSKFLALPHVALLSLIVGGYTALRVFLALRDGVVMAGDNAPEAGAALGRLWAGEVTFDQLLHSSGPEADFFRERSSQLLYPLLISLHRPLGLDIATHLLVLNAVLGAILIVASYFVGVRLSGKSHGVLVALLMCSLTGPYWIGRFAVVDNIFYAVIPLVALAILHWDSRRTRASAALMILAFAAMLLTRPESMLVVFSIIVVFAWKRARRSFSRLAVLMILAAGLAAAAIGAVAAIHSSPLWERTVLTRHHVAWGLAGSAHTLLNRGSSEFDALLARYAAGQFERADDMHYQMSMDAIATIRDNPFWYALKIPLRGLALLLPWTYQPWSLSHIAYEAAYTIFVIAGLVLLIRRGYLGLPVALLLAIPFSILLLVSLNFVDNDLKHRNGILVALNLVAPLGYAGCRDRRGASARAQEKTAVNG